MIFRIKKHCITLLLPLMMLCSCGSSTPPTQAQMPGTHPVAPPASQPPVTAAAQPSPTAAFAAWIADFKREALAKGISQPVLDDAFAGVIQPSDSILERDHTQPEKTKSFPQYLANFLKQKRIDAAREQWDSRRELLAQVEKAYGVPAPVLLALWQTESNFGKVQGKFSIVESLATLAYDGRRSAFFRKELLDALIILQQQHMPSKDLTGSWAGAMGQVQFMPSSFLTFAVDFDGDGKKDIWNNDGDALASMANYLHSKGWDASGKLCFRVRVPQGADAVSWAESKEWHTLKAWQKLGLRRANGARLKGDKEARLVMPDNDPADAYLAYANYDVIMDWNHSTYFATAVSLLADAIAQQEKN
jgi:membrane-bound lytic murein transglycosylase B